MSSRSVATPVMDAMFSIDEPHTGPSGTLAWAVDVDNAATGLRDFEHGVVVVADYLSDEAEGTKLLDGAVESGVRRSAEYTEGLAGVRLSRTECKHPHAVPVGE